MLLALEVVPHSFIFIIYQRGKGHANENDPTNFQENQVHVRYRKKNSRIGIKVVSGQPRALLTGSFPEMQTQTSTILSIQNLYERSKLWDNKSVNCKWCLSNLKLISRSGKGCQNARWWGYKVKSNVDLNKVIYTRRNATSAIDSKLVL